MKADEWLLYEVWTHTSKGLEPVDLHITEHTYINTKYVLLTTLPAMPYAEARPICVLYKSLLYDLYECLDAEDGSVLGRASTGE